MTSVETQSTPVTQDGLSRWSSFIDGAFIDSTVGETFAVFEAATGLELAKVVVADTATVDRAVLSSRRAFDTDWRHRSPRERADLLRRVGERLKANAPELAELEA